MTVYRPPDRKTYRFDFEFHHRRYVGTTGCILKRDAEAHEADLKQRLRARASGLPVGPSASPRFTEWAETYYTYASKRVTRPERLDELLRVVLRFWGRKPGPRSAVPAVEGEPYHDLRLADPILAPEWILKFEAWIDARGSRAQTRNHYRSILSRMYRVALLPQFRASTGVMMNPFAGIPRDPTPERTVTISVPQLRAWLKAASPHVRTAIAIAALAPQLRLQDVLRLRWADHLDPDYHYLTIHAHKTAARTGRPQVLPISAQLKALLQHLRAHTASRWVVTYHGLPVTGIRHGVASAAKAAGLTYGRDREGGVTFHTLRHSMASLMAELGLPESQRKEVMGHADLATTQKYTHLRPEHLKKPIERLSKAVPLLDLFGVSAPAATGGKTAGLAPAKARKAATKRGHVKGRRPARIA